MAWIHSAEQNFPIIRELKNRRFNAFIRRRPNPKGEYKIYVQKKHRPTAHTSRAQHRSRTLFSRICVAWGTLSEFQKETWDTYHLQTLECANSWFQYVKNNMQLMYPNIPGTSILATITSPPQHPEIPQELALEYTWPADNIELTWKDTYSPAVWIQSWIYGIPGRRRHYNPRWKFVDWYPSPYEIGNIYARNLHPGRIMAVTIRALNPRGEVSPYAKEEEEEVPERPVIKISASPRSGEAPLSVQFTDLSTGLISSHLWAFGDLYTSEEQNPLHVYDADGSYHVRLSLGGPADSITKRTFARYINVETIPPPYPNEWRVEVDNTADPFYYTNLQVRICIPSGSPLYDYLDAGGGNIRFYDTDRETKLPYWQQTWTHGGTSYFWITIPGVPPSTKKDIYVYATPSGDPSESSGDDVFWNFDDFPGATIDPAKWTTLQGSLDIYSGYLRLLGTSGTRGRLISTSAYYPPFIVECQWGTPWWGENNQHIAELVGVPDDQEFLYMWLTGDYGKLKYRSKTGGVLSDAHIVDIAVPAWPWGIYKSVYTATSWKHYQDGVHRFTHTDKIPPGPLAIHFYEGTRAGSQILVVWVYTRTWCNNDPITTIIL